MNEGDLRNMWSRDRVAEVLGVSKKTVARLAKAGKLVEYQLSSRLKRYDPVDVMAYLQARKGNQK